jgi:acetoin utilization deacetylase AcuC-like enzyme
VPLTIPVVWSDRCLLHEPRAEVWIGKPQPTDEPPARATLIRDALMTAGSPLVQAEEHADEPIFAVHDPGLVEFLREAWNDWQSAGYPTDPGQDEVVAYIFRHHGLVDHVQARVPASTAARTGFYSFDTMTPIGRGTWPAARAAVDVALTAADVVSDGGGVAYACTRPPGHHVTSSAYGGSCYLNTSAITAQYLRDRGFASVALVDLDAHHGNGAQSIFWERGDVFTGSVHADPAAGWFPHYFGLADETGEGPGSGANLNLPLAPGAGDEDWVEAVEELVRKVHADALVVALGVDPGESDRYAPLCVTEDGFRACGRALGSLGLPTVVVQEGGYDLATLGQLVLATLEGIEEGRA